MHYQQVTTPPPSPAPAPIQQPQQEKLAAVLDEAGSAINARRAAAQDWDTKIAVLHDYIEWHEQRRNVARQQVVADPGDVGLLETLTRLRAEDAQMRAAYPEYFGK